jgi:Ca2+-binding RTX toxin-like protein
MRNSPIPAFRAAPEEPTLYALEPQPAPGAFPGEIPRLLPAGRKAVSPRVEHYYRQLKALPRRVRRALTRRYARSLAGVALLLALGQLPALAATITVGGSCTLVDAITAANTDLATGGCPEGSGADVIALTGNVTLSAVNNTTDGQNGLPSVTSPITLNGNGHTLQRSTVTGTADFRLLHVADTGNLTLNHITLTNGQAGPPYYFGGGAVFNNGTLALNESTVSGNSDGGLYNRYHIGTATLTNSTVSGNSGGGIDNGGILTVSDSTISGNTDNYGGGISNDGILTLTNSTVSGNTAYFGGGVRSYRGSETLTHSTVSGNSGGGLSNFRGSLTLTDSIVSSNSGGGVSLDLFDCDDGDGGEIATITNSTISGNGGVGLFVFGDSDDCGTVTLTHSTVSGNRDGGVFNSAYSFNYGGGRLHLVRSLISGNNGPEVDNTGAYGGGTVYTDNFNFFGHDGDAGVVGFTPGATDIVPTAGVTLADILDPLDDNGGPTQTHALVAGSPALDASPIDKDCAVTDQRGAFRPQGPACDIGAFEADVEPDPFASPTPTPGCTVNGVPDQPCRGTSGPDRIIGTRRSDVILGLEGDDYVNGRGGDNRVFGGPGNDRLIGGKGDDQFFGQEGDDDLRGYSGNDRIEGGDGDDRLKGHEGDDRLRGGDGNDALRGLEGQDTLEGGTGGDLLLGGMGGDSLNGGPGADRLNGGGGFDGCTSDTEDRVPIFCE